MHRISWVAEQLSACQGFYSAELVIQYLKSEHKTDKVHYIPDLFFLFICILISNQSTMYSIS
jgi:lipid-A-disaccharide synthase-like uncharacterized protein